MTIPETEDGAFEARLGRIEARLAIQDLTARYARAVDSRDLDGLVGLFIADVNCGALGHGRETLKAFFAKGLTRFYRSIHQLCGQVIDLVDENTARGTVYCRAEHEIGNQWIVEALCYFDTYARRDGQWLFARRQVKLWYATDWTVRPGDPVLANWPGRNEADGMVARLPGETPTWGLFWATAGVDIPTLTRHPE